MSEPLEIIEIECPRCGNSKSYRKFLQDHTEYGECISCGEMTYHKVLKPQPSTIIRCPYCGSPDTKKIGTVNRLTSVATLGLASSAIGKQMQCKKCGNKF